MSRPKSAGSDSSRFFLDDLLGTNDEQQQSSRSSSRQRKSVRFFDEPEDRQQQQQSETSRPRSAKPHSSTLDSLLETKPSINSPSSQSSLGSSNRSKSDWLGLDSMGINEDDNNDSLINKTNGPIKSRTMSSESTSDSLKSTTSIKANVSNDDSADWITAGLKARQSRIVNASNVESNTDTSSSNKNRNWQPKIIDNLESLSISGIKKAGHQETTETNQELHPSYHSSIALNEKHQSPTIHSIPKPESNLNENSVQDVSGHLAIDETRSVSEQSISVLETKLRILTMEKSFLEQTVDQMKRNHQDELTAMVSLYEQQMRLTSEMYKRHEDMIQEERDRRIIELKAQLDQSEKELESIRNKYKEHLALIEEEYRIETKRIQDSYTAATNQLIEEHEKELKRLEQRLRNENETTVQTSTDLVKHQYKSVSELMAKWEDSAYKIEKLQRSVIVKQEELIREQLLNNPDEVLATKINDIESRWKTFINDMQKQQSELEESIRIEHEKYLSQEVERIKETEEKLDQERKELETLRQSFAGEVNDWRNKESIEAEKLHNEREKLKEEVSLFEERRSLLETLYNERKEMLHQEQTRLTKHFDELIKKQNELDQKESQLMKSFMELETQKQQWQSNKLKFDQEKEELTKLGQKLSKKAEELEKLSQMALKEKLDGINAMDEIERLRSEMQRQTDEIKKAQLEIEMNRKRLTLEQGQLEHQFKMFKELKDTIVCNLCGSSLNRGNVLAALLPSNFNLKGSKDDSGALFYSLINGGYFMKRQSFNINDFNRMETDRNTMNIRPSATNERDIDQTLLLWQMAAQQDAASLAEETKFLKIIMNNHKLDRFEK